MAGKSVFEENTFTVVNTTLSDGGSVTVEADAFIMPPTSTGLVLNPSTWKVVVDGTIRSLGDGLTFASNVSSVGNSKLTVGDEGSIVATGASTNGVKMGVPVDIANAGLIQGKLFGINADFFGPTSSKGFTIVNAEGATIAGGDTGIFNGNTTPAMTVKNAGEIIGQAGTAIEWNGAFTLVNDGGTIDGNLISGNKLGTFATSITNSNLLQGDISLSNGDDTLKNAGVLFGTVSFYEGTNKITNSGTIFDALVAGSGNNTLTNSGSLDAVTFGGGKNTVTNSDSMSTLTLGGGDDTVKNSGTIDSVTMGDGSNTLTNSGDIDGTLTLGSGDDTVHNTKYILTVILGNGSNSLTNSGDIISLLGGTGTDIVKNTGEIGTVDLKGGDDTFIGANTSEQVSDDLGNDTYKLGGGDDRIALASGNDNCDGGAGSDNVDLGSLATICFVNLDTKAVVMINQTLGANTVATAGIAASSLDLINGTAGANVLYGAGGNDVLAGGLGSGRLTGGTDNDTFV